VALLIEEVTPKIQQTFIQPDSGKKGQGIKTPTGEVSYWVTPIDMMKRRQQIQPSEIL